MESFNEIIVILVPILELVIMPFFPKTEIFLSDPILFYQNYINEDRERRTMIHILEVYLKIIT